MTEIQHQYPPAPILHRSINVNRMNWYYSILDQDMPNLPAGSTILFEWCLASPFTIGNENKEDIYEFGFVRYEKNGSREFVYEKRYGFLKELKTQFTDSYI